MSIILNKYLKRGFKDIQKYMKGIPKVSKKKLEGESSSSKLKIPITFNSEQLKLIESYSGILGNTKAEIIRNIVINWMLTNKLKGGEDEKN